MSIFDLINRIRSNDRMITIERERCAAIAFAARELACGRQHDAYAVADKILQQIESGEDVRRHVLRFS